MSRLEILDTSGTTPYRAEYVGNDTYRIDALDPGTEVFVRIPGYGPQRGKLDSPYRVRPYEVVLNHIWPYDITELPSGSLLDDLDVIQWRIEYDALPPAPPGQEDAIEIAIESSLHWWKQINVPDGETQSSWNISTGAPWFGARRFWDSITLWAHQGLNGQALTFSKAKGGGFLWTAYQWRGLNAVPPRGRIVFTWLRDT
ncbi:hypothetical protein JYK22_06110, partial [Nonomuraea sp. RK-328]|nr:hypothetical protein [Nonomuraea sp. RK-328]